MRFIIPLILLFMISCSSQNQVVNVGERVNLTDFGTHIDISDSKYGGTLMINLGFYEEVIYIKGRSGVNSTSQRILDSGIDLYDSRGQKIGLILIGGGNTISSDILDGSIYEFKKTYQSGGTYVIQKDGEKVGTLRIHDEKRMSMILYGEVNFDIIIHTIYYLE